METRAVVPVNYLVPQKLRGVRNKNHISSYQVN